MMDPALLRVLERAYDAPLDQGRWAGVLDVIVDAFEAQAASLLLSDATGPLYTVSEMSARYRELVARDGDLYAREYMHHEADDWTHVERLGPLDVLFDTDLATPLAMRDARPDYRYLRESAGVGRRIGFRLNTNPGFFDVVSVGFPAALSVVPPSVADRTRLIIPHLAKAMELTRTFGLLRQRYAAVLAAIDHLRIGLAISLPSGEILVANAEARRQFAERDAIWLSPRQRIATPGEDVSGRILTAVAAASETALGRSDFVEDVLPLPKRSGGAPVILDVAPLSETEGTFDRTLRGAVLTLVDPDHLPDFDIPRFATLHGLSAAEAAVCALLAQGETARSIAEKRSTSFETARNQMKSILAKTGCSNRGQLLRLIARTVPPIS